MLERDRVLTAGGLACAAFLHLPRVRRNHDVGLHAEMHLDSLDSFAYDNCADKTETGWEAPFGQKPRDAFCASKGSLDTQDWCHQTALHIDCEYQRAGLAAAAWTVFHGNQPRRRSILSSLLCWPCFHSNKSITLLRCFTADSFVAAVGIAITFGNETLRAQAIIAPPPIHSHRQGYRVQRAARATGHAMAAADAKTPHQFYRSK